MNARASLVSFVALLAICSSVTSAAEWRLTVQAGDFDRVDTVVAFTAPDKLRGAFSLRTTDGAPIPLQIDVTGRAIFIEPSVKKGQSKTYTLAPTSNLPVGSPGTELEFAL